MNIAEPRQNLLKTKRFWRYFYLVSRPQSCNKLDLA